MNTSIAILWPPLALMAWTMIVLLQVAFRRFRAFFAGRVGWHDFDLGEAPRVPADVVQANRAFMNLLEVPVLFYVLCLMCFTAGLVDPVACTLAWAYVGLRCAHSLVHLTYNRVLHRFVVFAMSNGVVVALLLWVAWAL